MRYLAVKYRNNVEDIVSAPLLDQMIASGSIRQFYRPSEQRWIILGVDRIRGTGGTYEGEERRRFIVQPANKISVSSHVPTSL
jgi:hypothetical protein